MMTTGPLPSPTPAVPTPSNAARKSIRADDANGKTSSFADFLPDKKGSSQDVTDAEVDSDTIKLKAIRQAADNADDTKEAALATTVRPPGPPMMPPITAMSVQQATLAAVPTPALTADEAADRAKEEAATAAATVSTDTAAPRDLRFGMASIRPHGPPPLGGMVAPADLTTRPSTEDTGGVKAIPTLIEPNNPPVNQPVRPWNDARQMVTASATTSSLPDDTKTVPPNIEPHGPPDQPDDTLTAVGSPAANSIKQAAPSPIEPHGPPEMPDDTLTAVESPAANTVKQANPSPIVPHGPPDLPDLTVKAATTVLPGPTKQPPLSPIEPHGPPDLPDAAIRTATTPAGDRSKKAAVSPIEPHGPPVMADDTLSAATVIPGDPRKAADVSLIESHGPPTIPDDTLAAGTGTTVNGSNKLEYTTTTPAPTGTPGSRFVAVAPLTGRVKGGYTTTISNPVGDPQDPAAAVLTTTGAPADDGGSFWAGDVSVPKQIYSPTPPVEITSAAQAWMPIATSGTPGATRAAADDPSADAEDAEAAEAAPISTLRPAILAARPFTETSHPDGPVKNFHTQTTLSHRLNDSSNGDGTPVAKEQGIVTAETANPEVNIDRSSLLRRGAAGSPAGSFSGRVTTATGVEKAAAIMPAMAVDTTTNLRADASTATAANPVQNAEHVQKMLQTVLDAGIKVGANGASQMEMRVRLDGGTNDVTVRLQMQDSRMHVTFQTSSPELRQALERGWSDFTTHAAQTSPVTVEPLRFVADAATRTQNAADFSSGQQNPSRQDDAKRAADDAATMTGSSWRGSRIVSSTATQPTPTAGSSSDRWTGWA